MQLGFIGYGDAGKAIAAGLHESGRVGEILAWTRSAVSAKTADENGVRTVGSLASLLTQSDVIFVLVPGAAALETAEKAAAYLTGGKLYLDLTTASPKDMRLAAQAVCLTGADFADGAMMDTVPKYRQRVPVAVCGPAGEKAVRMLAQLGMNAEFLGPEPGTADAVKLLRSVYTKTHLACVFEMLEAAEHYGVAEYVMQGLARTMDAKTFTEGMDSRTTGGIIHAARRSHELESAAQMLEQDGLSATLTRAGADKLRQIGLLDIRSRLGDARPETWQEALRALTEAEKDAQLSGSSLK